MFCTRLVLVIMLLTLACGESRDSVGDTHDYLDGRATEVILDLRSDLEAGVDLVDARVTDSVDIDYYSTEFVDAPLDADSKFVDAPLDADSKFVDGPLEADSNDAGASCIPSPSTTVDLLRTVKSDGSVSLTALTTRPGGGFAIVVNSDGEKLIWGDEELAKADCPSEMGCSDALVFWTDNLFQVERVVRLHGDGVEKGLAVSVDDDGRVLLVGTTNSPHLEVGEKVLSGSGQEDGFALAFDAGGEVLWSIRTGGTLDDAWNVIAPDGKGGAVVGGWFESQTLQLGGETLTNLDDNCILLDCGDLLLAGVDPNGGINWTQSLGGNQGERFISLHSGEGAFNVVGSFGSWGLDLGGELIAMKETICGPMFGCSDLFAGRYSSVGEHLWSKGFGGDLLDVALAGASAPDGGLLFVGEFSSSSLDVGGGPLVNNGDHESFVARLDDQGDHLWSLQVDAFLRVAVAGPENTTLAIGEQAPYQIGFAECPVPEGTGSQFLAGLISGTGALLGHVSFASFSGPLRVSGLAVSGDRAAVGGTFQGLLEMPGADLMEAEGDSVFLYKIPASLTLPEAL